MMRPIIKAAAVATIMSMLSCAQTQLMKTWERTIDRFDPETHIYHNESIRLRISFPDDWEIFAELHELPPDLWESRELYDLEKRERAEIAMVGHHISKGVLIVQLFVQKNPESEIPEEDPYALIREHPEFKEGYSRGLVAELVEELKKAGLAEAEQYFVCDFEERSFSGLPYADLKYKITKKKQEVIFREAWFFHSNHICRLRIFGMPFMYNRHEATIKDIFESISTY